MEVRKADLKHYCWICQLLNWWVCVKNNIFWLLLLDFLFCWQKLNAEMQEDEKKKQEAAREDRKKKEEASH